MSAPDPMETPVAPARPRAIESVADLLAELGRLGLWDRASTVPAVDSGADGDPFVIDGITLAGGLLSSELEAYIALAERLAGGFETLAVAVRWALVDLRAQGDVDLERLERRLDEAYRFVREELEL